jgi:hypothetical protein
VEEYDNLPAWQTRMYREEFNVEMAGESGAAQSKPGPLAESG